MSSFNLIKPALGDALLTSLFVFISPLMKLFTSLLASLLGFQATSLLARFITTLHSTLQVLIFMTLGNLVGGATFNPSTTLAFYAAGLSRRTSLVKMAGIQFPAQAFGGAIGAKAIMILMPQKYYHFVKGPSLKVDMKSGAIVEGVLTFGLCFCMLWVMLKGPIKSLAMQIWVVKVATVGLAMVGREYTGPCMNPANAFGWAYVNGWHNSWELFLVYWVGSLVGAVLAAGVFRVLFPQSEIKKKKKKKKEA